MRAKTWVSLLAVLALAAGAGLLFTSSEPAQAGFTSEDAQELVEYIEGGASLNLRLQALDALRRMTDSGIEGELAKLAGASDLRIAIYATTQLGKKNTSAAKQRLLSLVTDSAARKDVRKAAMTAVAAHWKVSSDLSWLESNTASDSDLKAHCQWLKSHVYER